MKKTKTKLGISLVAMILIVFMLLGSTYAWFTDSVSNTGNRIQAGTLKIDLLMYNEDADDVESDGYVSIADQIGDIFNGSENGDRALNSNKTLWEPGKTQIVYLAVENQGSLALKYTAYIDVTDEGLCDDPDTDDVDSALECVFLPVSYEEYKEDYSTLTTWAQIKEAAIAAGISVQDVYAGRNTITTGVLDEIANDTPEENERDYVALAVHMKEDAGNAYQDKDAIIDVTISATQYTAEKDGFGTNTYDADAIAITPSVPVHEGVETSTTVKKGSETLTFTASGDVKSASLAKSSAQELFTEEQKTDNDIDMLLNLNVDTVENTEYSVTYDLTLYKTITTNNVKGETEKVTDTLSTYLTANIQLVSGLNNVKVTHSGNAMDELTSANATPTSENGGYYYDSSTGILTIKSKSFSPFKVVYEIDKDAEVLITKGDKIIGYTSFVEFKQMILDTDNFDNFYGYNVKLLKDIDLSEANMDLFRANTNEIFAGTLDGNNHSISGFNNKCTSDDSKYASLFYYLYNVTIKDLTIKDSTFDNAYWSSSFIAYQAYGDSLLLDNVDIVNCHITNGWENQFYIFAPSSDITIIKNCSTDAQSTMDCIYGNYGCWFRQVCYTDFNMIDCVNNASMRGRGFVGAFVGQLGTNVYNATFTNCINNGNITVYESSAANSRYLYCGGFIGYKNSSVADNTIPQTITFTNCQNNGKIIVEDVEGNTGLNGGAVGGYIGYTNGTTLIFNNCQSNGNVGSSLIQRAAGYVGWENGSSTITFTNCTQVGDVTANSTNGIAGAYVAANNGTTNMTVNGSTSTGTIDGNTITKITGE